MNANNDDLSSRLRASLGAAEAPTLSADLVTGAAERPVPHIVNRGRRAVAAGGLALLTATAVTTALVVTSPFAQTPLFTAAGGSAANEMSATSDSRLAIWTNYEYVPGDSLSTSTGSSHVYQLQRTGTPERTLEAAAAALGVAGEPAQSQYFDEAYPTYVIGAEDGTAPGVVVSWTGTGDWWYNDPAAYPQATCDADGVCEQPPVTENKAPDEADARSIAHEIFTATGFDVNAEDIRVTADEWQTVASASLVVDGTQTALDWSVGWSTTGLISFAYGHSVEVVDKGSYGTVSAHEAVGRLADWRWFGSAGPEFQGGINLLASDMARTGDVTADVPTTESTSSPVDPGTTTDPSTAEPVEPTDVPTEEPTEEPMPEPTLVDPTPEPMPTPETVVVTVTEATSTLLLVWDADGNAWLVPGFAMPHPDGWFNSVISLVEGVIALPEPIATEPFDGEIAY